MNGVIWKGGSVQVVSPDQASAWLENHYNPDYQRDIKQKHVRKLAELMSLESYLTGHVALAHMIDGKNAGRTLIANGAHSLSAMILAGKPQRLLVENYHCQDDAAFASLFHAFDTEERKRTWKECARAFLLGNTTLNGMHATRINEFRSGWELLQRIRNEEPETLRYERFASLGSMGWIMHEFDQLQIQAVSQMLFRRSAVVAAIIASFERAGNDEEPKSRVRDFWGQVVTGFFTDKRKQGKHYPPHKLHQHIRSVGMTTSHVIDRSHPTVGRKKTTSIDLYAACINALNAWLKGESLANLRGAITTKKSGTVVPSVVPV